MSKLNAIIAAIKIVRKDIQNPYRKAQLEILYSMGAEEKAKMFARFSA